MLKKITSIMLTAFLLVGCADGSATSSDSTVDISYNENQASSITLGEEIEISGSGLSLSDSVVTISSPGTYIVTGETDMGKIVVDCASKGDVKIVLRNVTMESDTGPVITVSNASTTYIIAEDTNVLTVSGSDEDEEDSAIMAHDDLVIAGDGTLEITSEGDGIHANDTCVIEEVTLTIDAESDGLDVNDALTISDSNMNVVSGEDAIKLGDSDTVGTITVTDSSLDLTSGDEGMDSTGEITLNNVILTILAGGGYEESTRHTSMGGFDVGEMPEMNDENRPEMPENGQMQEPPSNGGNTEAPSDMGQMEPPEGDFDGEMPMMFDESTEEDESSEESVAKGIKSDADISITNCTITIDAQDDAIHSNGSITIDGNTLTLSSGDDGIHSDATLTVNSGTITVEHSYEGLEACDLIINDGTVSVTSDDDGINTTNPNATGDEFSDDGSMFTMNGGSLTVDAGGDGIDMNGSGEMNGGTVTVYGPTMSADGALDYNGTFTVNGGTLLAGGASGMVQMPSASENVYVLSFDASSDITVKDSEGNAVLTYSSEKSFGNLVIASDTLKGNETYTIEQDGEVIQTVTLSEQVTNLSTQMSFPNNGGGMPFGEQTGNGQ